MTGDTSHRMQNVSGCAYGGSVTTSTTDAPVEVRTTRRRGQTRTRLLAAALEVLAEEGLARSSVERICERAGYTRGAFYSNFTSTDDVVAALYAQQAQALLDHVEERLAQAPPGHGGTGLSEVVAHVLAVLPLDRDWHAVRTEFTAQALRNPEAAAVTTRVRGLLRERLAPLLAAALERSGRRLLVPAEEVARAVVTVHEGTVTPHLLGDTSPDEGFVVRLVTGVLETLTTLDPTDGPRVTR